VLIRVLRKARSVDFSVGRIRFGCELPLVSCFIAPSRLNIRNCLSIQVWPLLQLCLSLHRAPFKRKNGILAIWYSLFVLERMRIGTRIRARPTGRCRSITQECCIVAARPNLLSIPRIRLPFVSSSIPCILNVVTDRSPHLEERKKASRSSSAK
jgi:hypothetical protein